MVGQGRRVPDRAQGPRQRDPRVYPRSRWSPDRGRPIDRQPGLGREHLAHSDRLGLSTAMSEQPPAVQAWHAVVESGDPALLDGLLADDVVFRSPAVFAPQEGKALTTSYLSAALSVLGPTLRYVSQWHDHASAVLEFEADLDGVYVEGVDILRWNAEG